MIERFLTGAIVLAIMIAIAYLCSLSSGFANLMLALCIVAVFLGMSFVVGVIIYDVILL